MSWGVGGFLLALSWLFAPLAAKAEPWLSTRYAQNCSGCHAPGRKNLEPMGRRCTLSCQGCHVNPNGGGLRSVYGKWNEERWLRSFRADLLENPRSVAPIGRQVYGKDKAKNAKGSKAKDQVAKEDSAREDKPKAVRGGFPLVEVNRTDPPERLYARDGLEWVISQNEEEFLYQIPQKDPYRVLAETKTSAGADIRWQVTDYAVDDGDPVWHSFLMTADLGLEWRPIYRNVHLVYEARMLGSPQPGGSYESQLGAATTRSLYLMVDNLPFNVFVMGGYYRPLFGNFVPDHYALAQEMTSYGLSGNSKNYNLLYNAISIGTAPNVPYLNVHFIQKRIGDLKDRTSGFAANLGLRFVTLGGSLNYSYWRTQDEQPDAKTGVEMHSIGAAAKLWRVVTSLEGVSIQRDTDTTDFRQGGVYTLDTNTQIWRENYFTLMAAKANTTAEILPGSAQQIKVGLRSFVVPGVDVQVQVENREETSTKDARTTKKHGYSGQLHLYF